MKTALLGSGIVPVPVSGTGVTIIDSGGYFGGGPLTLEEVLALIGAGTAPGSFLRTTLGGVGNVQALGTLGATETIDLANGNYFWGTLDQACTIAFTGWTNLKDCWIVVELIEDGTGGWTPTFSGVTWEGNGGAVPVHPTTAGTFTRYLFHSRDGGTTIVGNQAGGSGVTIKDEGSSLATTASSIDFAGAGVVASGTGAAKTVTIPGTPTGAAGGDLSGTYPNPSVVDDSHAHTAATLPAFVTDLDDLTDVVIASVADRQRLRYNAVSGFWENSSLAWEPHTSYDGTVVVNGAGDPVMIEMVIT